MGYPQPNSEECHKDGVRSDRQKPEFASGPLGEGLSNSDVCPIQIQQENHLTAVTTNQKEVAVECDTGDTRTVSQRDES